MGLNWPKAGASYVPAYQASGLPYVTRSGAGEVSSTPVGVYLPYVTRFFIVGNPGPGDLRVGFTQNGVSAAATANYFTVPAYTSGSVRYEIRCKQLYFMRDGDVDTSFELFAGLTNIHADQFPTLTGSLISVGFGAPVTSSWPGVG